jgi:hypothetical protein
VLELCPLPNAALDAEQGGPMSDSPAFYCAHDITAAPDRGGQSYTFTVSGLPLNDGSLAFAILATGPGQRAVLNQPGSSLQLHATSGSAEMAALLALLGFHW